MISAGGDSDKSRIGFGFRLATARLPSQSELAVLEGVLANAMEKYATDQAAAESLLTIGESKRDDTLSLAEHAAWTVVASTIINLDETLTRE